jgi:hypothetical protein
VKLAPHPIVLLTADSLSPEAQALSHDEQQPFERLDRRRELAPLDPRYPCLTGAGSEGKATL